MNSFNQLKQSVSNLAKSLKIDIKATGNKVQLQEKWDSLLKIKEERERPVVVIEETHEDTLIERIKKTFGNLGPMQYPIQIEYKYLSGDDKQTIIENRLFFKNQDDLEKYINAVEEKDTKDHLNGYFKHYSVNVSDQTNVIQRQRIQRSAHGQGNNLQNCNVIDNELVYVPQSGKCLYRCIIFALGGQKKYEILKQMEEYAERKNIYRHNFRQSDLIKLEKILGCQFNYYRHQRKEWRYELKEGQICVGLYDNHFFLIKDVQRPTKCFKYVVDNLVWEDKTLQDAELMYSTQKIKFHECEDDKVFDNVYMYDLECFQDENRWFVPYACGFAPLKTMVKNNFNRKDVTIYSGENCIMDMLKTIDRITKKKKISVANKQGKQTQLLVKNICTLYAHNSSRFDSYFMLQLQECKIKRMVQKGGIMSLTLSGKQFENTDFQIKCTMKFLNECIKKLCVSFKVPEDISKQEMKHDDVTKDNYIEKKDCWWEYLQNDVLSLSYIWASFIQKMRQIVMNVDIKQYCSLPQFSYACMMKICDVQLDYFTDPVIRNFIQRSIRGGRVIARLLRFQTKNLQKILELNGVQCIDQLIGKILHQNTKNLIGNSQHIAFDATSLYASAMALKEATFLDPRTTQLLTNEQCQNFKEEDYKKFIVECDIYIPKDLQFVPISRKKDDISQFCTGRIEKIVVNDVDLRECLRFGIKVEKVHQGIYSEPMQNFMMEFIIDFFNQRKKVKDIDSILGDMYKLICNSCYGKMGQKEAATSVKFTNKQRFFDRVYDDSIQSYFEMSNGQICYTQKKDVNKDQQQSPHHIGSYILAYSKQIMNNFVLQMNGDKENLIHYMDTDSMYIDKDVYEKYLQHIPDALGGGKNDYGFSKGIIQADYLGPKQKICYVFDSEKNMIDKKVTWKGIEKEQFKFIDQKTVSLLHQGQDSQIVQSQWKRDKEFGVQYGTGNMIKKMSNQEYLKKMNLNKNVYEYRHYE